MNVLLIKFTLRRSARVRAASKMETVLAQSDVVTPKPVVLLSVEILSIYGSASTRYPEKLKGRLRDFGEG